MSRKLSLISFLICISFSLHSSDYLFFLEAQGIAGYSGRTGEIIFYSHSEHDFMQKPSIGFDLIKRFRKGNRDFVTFYLQPRMALTIADQTRIGMQLYNAYLKFKLKKFDLWLGHNRPAFGLAASFDTHAHLLQPITMEGFYPERDWGGGINLIGSRTHLGISLTTGSGMRLQLDRGWVFSAQLSRGLLASDNRQSGISLAFGRKEFRAMHSDDTGTDDGSSLFALIGLDYSFSVNNLENRAELAYLKSAGTGKAALFWRTTISFLREGILKFEMQPTVISEMGRIFVKMGLGTTFQATPDITLRQAFYYDFWDKRFRVVLQFYLYKSIIF